MSHCLGLSTACIYWATLQTYARTQHGPWFLTRWKPGTKSGLLFQLFAQDILNRQDWYLNQEKSLFMRPMAVVSFHVTLVSLVGTSVLQLYVSRKERKLSLNSRHDQCHSVLDNHRSVKCEAPCNRTPCPRRHPCSRRCSDECGECLFPMYQILLPCGHVATKVPWFVWNLAFECGELHWPTYVIATCSRISRPSNATSKFPSNFHDVNI